MAGLFSNSPELDAQGKGRRSFASAVGKKGTSRPLAETPRRGDELAAKVADLQVRKGGKKLMLLQTLAPLVQKMRNKYVNVGIIHVC
jgi:hypothetical protein